MVKLQYPSDGINYQGYQGDFITCVHESAGVSGKDERYVFRCSSDLECCGRECCIPGAAAGIPLWLLILLIVLAILFLLCLLAGLIYWCCSYWRRRRQQKIVKVVPPPPVAVKPVYKPSTLSRNVQTDPEPKVEPKIEYFPVVLEKSPPQVSTLSRRIQTDPPFEPSPMEESVLPTVDPIPLQYHHTDDLTQEKMPLISRTDPPPEQKATLMYLRPGYDQVAAY